MKTIEECIEESPAFLPSLEKLVNDALQSGEDPAIDVFIFHKQNENNETIVSRIMSGNNISLNGDHEDLVKHHAYSLGELLRLSK